MEINTAKVLEMPKHRGKYGDGGIRQLGPNRFMISFYDRDGRRRRESFSTYKKAEKALRDSLALRDNNKLDPVEGRLKVDTLGADYKLYIKNSSPKSSRWVDLVWRVHLAPFFGGLLAERIGSDHLERYRRQRLDEQAAPATVNHELTILKAAFNHALKSDPPKVARVPRFPEKLREANPRAGFLTPEQYAALQAKCKYTWLRGLLAIAYNFGFRKGELVGLRVSQVDLKARTIHLLPGETKNDQGRGVFMTEEVFKLISECVKGKQPGDPVFTWANGEPVVDFRRTWRTLSKAAGIPGLYIHDLRRTAVRNLIRAGVSKTVAKKISGHQTDAVFERYNITDESDLREAARRLEAHNGHAMGTA